MQEVIDNEAHSLSYDEQRQTVMHVIKKFNSLDEWKSLLMAGTNLLKEKKSSKWLSDNRLNSLHPTDGFDEWV